MKELEQVIMDAGKDWCRRDNGSLPVIQNEAAAIAEAVRGWMREQDDGLRGAIHGILRETEEEWSSIAVTDAILSVIPPRRVQSAPDRDRIKELEAEVARANQKSKVWGIADPHVQEWRAKAAKYDELRAKFPFLPGEEFYATLSAKKFVLQAGDPIPEWKIYKRTVSIVGENGIQDTKDNSWSWDECHPTAEACRAAIPVEE